MPHGTGYKICIRNGCSRFVVLGKDQLSFFDEAESSQDHKAEDPKPDTIFVEAHERKKKRSHAEMLKHLPEEEVLMEILEGQRLCR